MIRPKQVWLLLAAGAFIARVCNAAMLTPVSSHELVKEAELIFQGVVTAVEYRISDVALPDHIPLPHTFVTFAIEQVFKGSAANGSHITLRFQGGPDGQGNVMLMPDVPLFDLGNRDILFVRNNGADLCPLVGCSQGRFHNVSGGDLYTDSGNEVWMTREGELAIGPHHPREEVVAHRIAGTVFEFATVGEQKKSPPPRGAQRLDATGFADFVGRMVHQSRAAQELANPNPVGSADIREAFYVLAPQPVGPPPVPSTSEAPDLENEWDPIEQELLRQSGGNPVVDGPSR